MSMWRPPERIRHDAGPGRWPSAAEALQSRLFQPIGVGALTLRQRTWVPAMVPWRATDDGLVTPSVLAWYERFARGRRGHCMHLLLTAAGAKKQGDGQGSSATESASEINSLFHGRPPFALDVIRIARARAPRPRAGANP